MQCTPYRSRGGETGEAESALKQKLKLTLKDPANASAQEWKNEMWTMVSETTRADRGIQETVWRSVMAYIERLTAFQASHYATAAAGTPYVPPTLAVVQGWVAACVSVEDCVLGINYDKTADPCPIAK